MSLIADSITYRKLVIIRQVYQRAVVQASNSQSTVDRLLSVVAFDLAIEMGLKAVATALDLAKTPNDTFPGVLQQAQDIMSKQNLGDLPERAHILHVHNVRNGAQHKASWPSVSDVSDCRTYTRDFLQTLVQQVWGIAFDQISLATLIQTPLLQQLLQEVDAGLVAGNWLLAADRSTLAMEIAMNMSEYNVSDSLGSAGFGSFVRRDDLLSDATKDTIEEMQKILRFLVLGVDYSTYVHFRRTVGSIAFYYRDGYRYYYPGTEVTESMATYALSYVMDTVLQMEERIGNLDPKPYYSTAPKRSDPRSVDSAGLPG